MKSFLSLLLLFTLSASAQDLKQGLVAWYPFDGTIEDAHGGQNIAGSTPVFDTGRFGQATTMTEFFSSASGFRFTGSFTYAFWIRVPANIGAGAQFPISMAVAGNPTNLYKLAWFEGDPGNLSWRMDIAATPYVQKGDPANVVTADGVWHHVVIWRDAEAGVLGVRVDGGAPQSTPMTGTAQTYGNEVLLVNRRGSAIAIDELAAWSRPLMAAEQELHASVTYSDLDAPPPPPPPAPEPGSCPFNTGSSATAFFSGLVLEQFQDGDLVEARVSDIGCVGSVEISATNFALTIWGDDFITPEKDGADAGQPWALAVHRGTDTLATTFTLDPNPPYRGTATYAQDALYALTSLAVGPEPEPEPPPDTTDCAVCEAEADALRAEIATLEEQITGLNVTITRLEDDKAALSDTLSQVRNDLSLAAATIDELNATIGVLEARVQTLETDVQVLADRIGRLDAIIHE